jgi:hydroxymethylbilane synthase
VAARIREAGGPECEIVVIRTSGDERPGPPDPPAPPRRPAGDALAPDDTVAAASGIGSANIKATFVKEIEDALLEGRVDLAVHSAKDLSATLPDGLIVAATLPRDDPRDALLLPRAASATGLDQVQAVLGRAPRIGTSSARRAALVRQLFRDAQIVPVRGNVDTRLRRLDAGECDALMLAAAGVRRLGLDERISALLPADVCVPAPGQGIVAIEIVQDAPREIRNLVHRISDADADAALVAERAVVAALGGGCQMPLGALAALDEQDVVLHGAVASLDGRRVVRAGISGNRGNPAAVGEKLAQQLLSRGAAELLRVE